jgi:acetyl-CoA acetyltransferase
VAHQVKSDPVLREGVEPCVVASAALVTVVGRTRIEEGDMPGAERGLRDRYCIVGVGETEYSRDSRRTTRAMAVEAIRTAMHDAGLRAADVDGMMSYQNNDSTPANWVAGDLGIRLNFYMDVIGGGSSTEALVGLAMGAIEAGMCRAVAIFRSMNGYSEVRGQDLAQVPFGMRSAGQSFAPTFMRHMYDYGTTSAQVAHVKVAHSKHASQNPKALLKERVTVDDVLKSRWIVKPLHLLDCCLETDNATCVIVTSAERARDLKQRPAYIMGVAGRVSKPRTDFHWAHGPVSRVAGYYAKDIVFAQAGLGPEDIHVTGSYDAFTFTTMLQLEEYGFCKKGEGGAYVSSGIIELGGKRPNNTSGGHLCEGYTHGMSMVIENVRQLRGTVDDYCPRAAEGVHTFDYSPGRCRQVKDAEITMNLGWAMPPTGSALIMRK